MKVGEWLDMAIDRLSESGIESARLDAQLLAAHVLLENRSWILAHPEIEINELAAESVLQRRENREPLAYILGWRDFYDHRFHVQPGVLVPRQETEILVEMALDLMHHFPGLNRVLDVGTGSGCIAISIAKGSRASVTAVDVSSKALDVAIRNAADIDAEVEFLHSDRLDGLEGRQFDLVVSNPPYIPVGTELMPEVGVFEPPEALFAGPDGLDAFRWLGERAHPLVRSQGWLSVEIGQGTGDEVRDVLHARGWEYMRNMCDLSNIERALAFRRKES